MFLQVLVEAKEIPWEDPTPPHSSEIQSVYNDKSETQGYMWTTEERIGMQMGIKKGTKEDDKVGIKLRAVK